MPAQSPPLEDVAHLTLQAGRILFQNNADTEEVLLAVQRLAAAFDCEPHLLVTYESLLLTISKEGEFRTKAGYRVPTMNVNMAAVSEVNDVVAEVEAGTLRNLESIRERLDAIEHQKPIYNRWLAIAGLSLTAASLSRLFGGDWPTFIVTFIAGAVGTWLRQEMGKRGWNIFFVAFAAAFVSGLVGASAVLLKISTIPALCLVAPGMIIVPGVPLVNCVQDMIKNHMAIGISRLGLASLITLAIAVGLFSATAVTGVEIPINETSRLPLLAEDALFSACAALGYLCLFNVPLRLAWIGVLCGVASHTTRTFCLQQGIGIVEGSFIGALVVGMLAHGFARAFRAPASAFAFPGVVAMIPGAYAFRAVIGCFHIIAEGASASPALVAETISLGATVLFMVLAIAIGVAAPLIIWPKQVLKRAPNPH